jgi:hypothetical protein
MQIGPSRALSRTPSRSPTSPLLNHGHEITSLTDKERDEIDFEAKSIIRQTMDRIQQMERLENGCAPFCIVDGRAESSDREDGIL